MARTKTFSETGPIFFCRACGGFAAIIGVMVMIGWYAHWLAIVQIIPGLVPMKFNTALEFALCGVGLLLLTTCQSAFGIGLGIIVAIIGGLTLTEYLTGHSLGIDETFFKYYIILPSETSPRMAPLSASCFVFIGMAFALIGRSQQTKKNLAAVGALACVVAVIAGVALFGYMFGIESAYGWGSYSRMAVHTATTFLVISLGLMAWAWHTARVNDIDFLRWLPVTGSVTLMVMVGFVSAISFSDLGRSNAWRTHSYEVLDTAQTFLGDIFNLQRGMRAYAYTSSPESFGIYQQGLKNAPQRLEQLIDETRDNPTQQANLKPVVTDLNRVVDYSHELLDLRQTQGIQAVIQLETTGKGFAAASRTLADLKTFTDEEHALLAKRSAAADANFHNMVGLLVVGSGLAAALLILANVLASREMRLRRRAENEQRKIVSLQKAILNSADYAIISTTTTGEVMTFNATAERWLGYSAGEVVGKETPALWHDAGEIVTRAALLSQELGRTIEPGFEVFTVKITGDNSYETEWTLRRKDGTTFPASLSATALTDDSGEITGYLGLLNDITERKKAEKKLLDQALILDLANDTIFIRDAKDRITYWNQGAERLYGWTKEEALGHVTHDLFNTRFPQPLSEIKRQLLAIGRWEGELEHTRRDGSVVTVASSWTLQRNESSLPVAVIEMNYDITARKKAEKELAQSREHLNAILTSSIDGVIVYDAIRNEAGVLKDFRFTMINPAAEKMMRMKASDLLGKTILEKFPSVGTDGLFDKYRRIVEENVVLDFEYESRRTEIPRWYRLAGVKLGDGLALSYTEITARKLFEKELQEAKERAESSDRAKSEFLAIMSHEIRTPMNGVIGMTAILSDTDLTEMQRDCVNTISTSGESLMTVINDILDFSKIESGRMQLETRSFNLERCIEEAIDLFAAPIRIKGLEAVYLVAPEIPFNLMGDALRLRQILVNLIGNALKFTSKGEIAINVERRSVDENGHHLVFAITDTGIGISKEGLEKLFKAFQQVDTSTTRRYGGTGLGLVISKRLAEFMGGTMWVESEPGVGSTFFFSAVLKASAELEPEAESRTRAVGVLTSHTVLIVDDNATNRRILEIQLKIWGMKPTSLANGPDALKLLDEQTFDAGLIDYQMPDMDGVTLAKEIRIRTQIPLILLSSSGEIITGDDASLFQMQIPKPIKHSTLFNALLKITGAEPRNAMKAPEKNFDREMATQHPLRILLAEDNAVNQKVGMLMLSRLGYSADLAKNGQQAVRATDQTCYDLILMDIQMPDMNGIEASRLVREKLGSNRPTIIALTAEALEGDKQRFLDLGFDGYLSKPLQVPALAEVLKSVKTVDTQSKP
jgi:PAS domain S-box-containing protein